MKTFLFQGDSITDEGRAREDGKNQGLGHGYPTMAAGMLHQKYPGRFHFLNRAVSGDRSIDLYARIKRDAINLKPDYLSVLIGVNDVWHDFELQNGCSAEQYERNCRMFYTEVKAALPEIRIFVLEPFFTKGTLCEGERWAESRRAVEKNAAAARRLADELGLIFVPLQEQFDVWSERLGAEELTAEGVHPVSFGHSVIAKALVDAVEREMETP